MSDAPVSGDLNRGQLTARLIFFCIPLVLGMFFHGLFNLVDLVDLIIVGKLGPYALAAIVQASLILMLAMVVSTGVNNASIAVISRNFGMRNYRRANANTLQSFILLFAMAVVIGVPSYIWAEDLCKLLGSEGEALAPATEYLRISMAGIITMFFLMQVTAVLRAGGDARWPMILLIGANVLNVLLSWGLVHGKWGLPKLDVPGAAWGTVIARGIFMVFGLYLITRPTSPVKLILKRIRIRPRMLWNLTRIGVPSSTQFVVRVVSYGFLLRYATYFGDPVAVSAAFAVGSRLDLLAIFTGTGWGAGAAAMVGQGLGAGLRDRAAHAGWLASFLNAIMMAGCGIVFYIYAPWFVKVFGRDPAISPDFARTQELAVEYLRVSVIGFPFVAVAITLAQALNGAGSTKTPLTLDALCYLGIQAPCAWYIGTHAESGDFVRSHIWWTLAATNMLAAIVYVVVWRIGHWKYKKIQ
ncbi:MAG: MATE family efflux transporter [Planctomycetota bacterium]|jgi:putative MATE family efflux protein